MHVSVASNWDKDKDTRSSMDFVWNDVIYFS